MSQKTATGEDVAFADIRAELLSRIEPSTVTHLPEEELVRRIERLLSAIANERQLALNRQDQALMTQAVVDDITGLGPLEFLLRDNSINGTDNSRKPKIALITSIQAPGLGRKRLPTVTSSNRGTTTTNNAHTRNFTL